MNGANSQDLSYHYSVLIQWSAHDNAYIVSFPEFPGSHTHGATREEALKNALEVIDLLVEARQSDGRSLPMPGLFDSNVEGIEHGEHSEYQSRNVS